MAPRERTIHLIDGSAQFYRAYFAIRGLATSRGLPTNATYGFTTMLRKLYQDEQPRVAAASPSTWRRPPSATRSTRSTRRTRRKMDDELRGAAALRPPRLRGLRPAHHRAHGLGGRRRDRHPRRARRWRPGYKVVVVSGDKDLLQLVTDDVLVLNPGREGVGRDPLRPRGRSRTKFGVPPERVVDVLALVGDSVDNVPGVPGIGDKGARDLVPRVRLARGACWRTRTRSSAPPTAQGLLEHRDDADPVQAPGHPARTTCRSRSTSTPLKLRRPRTGPRAHALFTELEFAALAKEYAPEPTATRTAHAIARRPRTSLRAFVAEARAAGQVALSLAALGAREPMSAELVGVGLACAEGHAVLRADQRTRRSRCRPVLPLPAVAEAACARCSRTRRCASFSARGKHDRILLRAGRCLACEGLALRRPWWPSYLLNPGAAQRHASKTWRMEHLAERPRATGALLEGGALEANAGRRGRGGAPRRPTSPCAWRPRSGRGSRKRALRRLYDEMELPLVEVLADMERAGVKVNLRLPGRDEPRHGGADHRASPREIHALAGGDVQHQLADPAAGHPLRPARAASRARRRPRRASSSTAEEVLEELAQHHELPRKILDYRAVQKLKSTYVDALPDAGQPARRAASTRRSNQTVAATGRLSVTDPNLQNIPIRTAEGRRIREAFVAEPGHLLLSADYSQIELRILAHLSKDPTLIDTFRRGEDVHDRTVARDLRRRSRRCRSGRAAPRLEDGQLRAPLREDGLHAGQGHRRPQQGGGAVHRRPTSRATRRCAGSSTRRSRTRARRAWCARCWAGCAACPT